LNIGGSLLCHYRLYIICQVHESAPALMRITAIGVPAGQASRSFLKEAVKTAARVDCFNNAGDTRVTHHNGALRGIGSAFGQNFIIERDLLALCNRFGTAIAQLQLCVPAIFRFNHLAL